MRIVVVVLLALASAVGGGSLMDDFWTCSLKRVT
jgi:hypothetical protein